MLKATVDAFSQTHGDAAALNAMHTFALLGGEPYKFLVSLHMHLSSLKNIGRADEPMHLHASLVCTKDT